MRGEGDLDTFLDNNLLLFCRISELKVFVYLGQTKSYKIKLFLHFF